MVIEDLVTEIIFEACWWTFRVTMVVMAVISLVCFGLGYLIGSSK